MANTKIGRINHLVTAQNATVVLKNGTGGGAPALIESAPYVMSNLLHHDRYTPWKSSTLLDGVSYQADFDMGSNKILDTFALHDFRLLAGTVVDVDVLVQSGAYTPGGTWVSVGTVSLTANARDYHVEFAATTRRSVRLELFPNGANATFTLGKCFAGDVEDMGGIHSPGGTTTLVKNRLETPLPNGAVVVTKLGADGLILSLPWRVLTTAQRTTLRALQASDFSALVIDADGTPHEMIVRGGQLVETRTFNIDADLELVKLP